MAHVKRVYSHAWIAAAWGLLAIPSLVFAQAESDGLWIQPPIGEGRPLAAVGQLRLPIQNPTTGAQGFANSTAFLVSPCYILATYHGVFSPGAPPDPARTLTYGFARHEGRTLATSAYPVMWGDVEDFPETDWSLLRLARCVGEQIGWLELATTTDETTQQSYNFAGFPGSRNSQYLWTDRGCSIYGLSNTQRIILHNCEGGQGASGGPIFFWNDDGVPVVAGLLVGGISRPPNVPPEVPLSQATGIGVATVSIAQTIAVLIDLDIKAFNAPNPATRDNAALNWAQIMGDATLPPPPNDAPPPVEIPALIEAIKQEMTRHRCYRGTVDTDWNEEIAAATRQFNATTQQQPVAETPAERLLDWQRFYLVARYIRNAVCS